MVYNGFKIVIYFFLNIHLKGLKENQDSGGNQFREKRPDMGGKQTHSKELKIVKIIRSTEQK